jgi:membrane dipeptidase
MLIVDAHQDLAWNMLTFGRDYTRSAVQTRQIETGSQAVQENQDTLLGWSDYQAGQVALIFATLFVAPQRRCSGASDRLCYSTYEQAHQLYSAQVDAYERLVDQNPRKFRLVSDQQTLDELLAAWRKADEDGKLPEHGLPVGLALLMEGAEGVRQPDELEWWRQRGVCIIGPAWAGTRYCGGTREPGPLTADGYALLEGMAHNHFILDLSHMDEKAVLQALDSYPGPIIASHSNPGVVWNRQDFNNRFLSDRMIHGLLERDGVIGIVLCNDFLKSGWRKGQARDLVTLHDIVAYIDYVCQLAGDASHVGLGSDFDGGFGLQSVPPEIDTIADLQKLIPLLESKGYSQEDIARIMGENWLAKLRQVLL